MTLFYLEVLNSSFYLEELNSSIEGNYFLEEEEEEVQRSDVIEFLWFAQEIILFEEEEYKSPKYIVIDTYDEGNALIGGVIITDIVIRD